MTKTRRGLGNNQSAQVFADLKRIEHNFCRPHLGLPNGITPAEAAGIDLKLGDNKLKSLITKSAQAKEQTKIEEYALEPQLGKRIDYIEIKREADCISIKPRGWLPKPVWREINEKEGNLMLDRRLCEASELARYTDTEGYHESNSYLRRSLFYLPIAQFDCFMIDMQKSVSSNMKWHNLASGS